MKKAGSGPGRTRISRLAVVAGIGAVLVVAIGLWAWNRARVRPNIILITIDTLRADHLGAYGDRRAATPVLDGLAGRGVRFADAVSHAPLTLPAHASILTGLTPPHHGVRNNPDFVLADSVQTMVEQFHAAGYATAAFVSGFPLHRQFGLTRGFDVY